MLPIEKNELLARAIRFTEGSEANWVAAGLALRPDLAGMRIFDPPLLAVADAQDPLFTDLQQPQAVGPQFLLPGTWLPEARSVLSFFLPFTRQVTLANQKEPVETPPEWLHARIEGQAMVNALARHLQDFLVESGYQCVVPSLDQRFWSCSKPAAPHTLGFTSNWSERHVAYVCGLGTFSLSRHLITAKGMAGRFGSVVTSLAADPDRRPYSRYDEYCTRCGACIPKCPVQAISPENGKDQVPCGAFLDDTMVRYAPRYGCGKCSVGVPCMSRIPGAKGAG